MSKTIIFVQWFHTFVSWLFLLLFLKILVSKEALFILHPKLNFETRIMSKLAKHKNSETVFFRIALT
jgi:hypothetical protein